jgi:hypothetical protein
MYLLLDPALGGTDPTPSRGERSRHRPIAIVTGTDVDQPCNPAKSVTVA